MGIYATTTDYTARKKDISVFQNPDGGLEGTQTVLPLFGKNPRFCAGVQKLVQKYAIILLTNISTQPNYPDFGTAFLYTINGGIDPTDKIAASQIFNIASYDAVATLRAYQSTDANIPADERIYSATLTGIALYSTFISFDAFEVVVFLPDCFSAMLLQF